MADFILECTILDEEPSDVVAPTTDEYWVLHVDGSLNITGAEAGLILTSPKGVVVEYALHFDFLTSNNEAEYEALIADLRMAKEIGIQHLRVHSDS